MLELAEKDRERHGIMRIFLVEDAAPSDYSILMIPNVPMLA
jgi:hypothetical protein